MRLPAGLLLLAASVCSSPAADPSSASPAPTARESDSGPALSPVSPRADWKRYLGQPTTWFLTDAARVVASNVLSHQSLPGAWPKNTNTADRPFPGDRRSIRGTWDNGATVSEVRFLARFRRVTGDASAGAAIVRAIEQILDAQYPTGGWPQFSPPGEGYHRHITFNDGTMVGLLELLQEAARDPEFGFLGDGRKARASQAIARGIDCIVRSQVRRNGVLTVWCAQHDAVTLEPRPARTFEPASLSGAESAGILRFLMRLEEPPPEVREAVRAGAGWFAAHPVRGIRVVDGGGDRVVLDDPGAGPLWARFYDLETQTPIFTGRDGVVRTRLADIERERRTGYAWYGEWGARVAADLAAWAGNR